MNDDATTAPPATIPPPPQTVPQSAQPVQRIPVTLFQDRYARTCEQRELTLLEIIAMLRDPPTANQKDHLPLLKLATFGNLPSAKGSLRHDLNVLSVTGCEIDYDAEKVSIEAAFQLLAGAGITCVLYTSWQHTPAAPRWRVLAPFSRPLTGSTEELRAGRARAVARINGALGGIVAPESFRLSQAFYYGRPAS